jgi:hypothetical protein
MDESGRFTESTLSGDNNHLRRDVTGEDRNTLLSKEDGIFAGSAVEFEDVVASCECLGEVLPNDVALGATDEGTGEQVVVALGQSVKGKSRLRLCGKSGRSHASTSA